MFIKKKEPSFKQLFASKIFSDDHVNLYTRKTYLYSGARIVKIGGGRVYSILFGIRFHTTVSYSKECYFKIGLLK